MPDRRPPLISDLLGAQVCIAIVVIAGAARIPADHPADAGRRWLIIVSMTIYQLGAAFSATLFVPAMAEQHMMPPAFINLLGPRLCVRRSPAC